MYIQKIVPNLYRDSVSLMQLSAALAKLAGIEQASAIMATPANLELLREGGLVGNGEIKPSPNDLLIAAIALANHLVLVTHNTREFRRVVGLTLEDWQTP